jgi:hypothetical protein
MKILALALAFAPILLAVPRTVAAEGKCPRSWDLLYVAVGFPGDLNLNGMVCAKEQGNPNDDDVEFVVKDDH